MRMVGITNILPGALYSTRNVDVVKWGAAFVACLALEGDKQ